MNAPRMFVMGVILFYLATAIFGTPLCLDSDQVTHFESVANSACSSLFILICLRTEVNNGLLPVLRRLFCSWSAEAVCMVTAFGVTVVKLEVNSGMFMVSWPLERVLNVLIAMDFDI